MIRMLFVLFAAPLLFAQGDEIRAMLKNSEAAWNRGDLAAFASGLRRFVRDYVHRPRYYTRRSPGDSRSLPPRLSHARSDGHADLFGDLGAALGQRLRIGQRAVCIETDGGGRRRRGGPLHAGATQDEGGLEDHSRSFELGVGDRGQTGLGSGFPAKCAGNPCQVRQSPDAPVLLDSPG